jgi:hypothetical protein
MSKNTLIIPTSLDLLLCRVFRCRLLRLETTILRVVIGKMGSDEEDNRRTGRWRNNRPVTGGMI